MLKFRMVSCERTFLCFILSCLCFFPVYVKGSESVYLSAGNAKYECGKLCIQDFKFNDGNKVHFVCNTTIPTGEVRLTLQEEQYVINDTGFKQNEAAVSTFDLTTAAHDGKTVACLMHDKISHKVVAINLRLVSNSSAKKPVNIWLIVLGVVVFLVVAAVALWIYVGYKNRRKQSPSNMVTFADRNSIENLDPRVKDKNEDSTYVSLQTDELTPTPVQHSDPNRISVQDIKSVKNALRKSENGYPKKIQTDEITYASLDFKERTEAPIPKPEPTYASIQQSEGNRSLQ